jgi:urease accessory protein
MISRAHLLTTTTVIVAALAPATALAHPGHDAGQQFVAGMLHPLSGLDHVLMIIAVSAWASLLKPAGRCIVAGCLALFVMVGAGLPFTLRSGPALESAIALTIVGSGMLLALGRRWSLWVTGAVAALFAMIHGFAHGAEGPVDSLAYVPGLAMTTGSLALAVSFLAARLQSRPEWLRMGGVAAATAGITALLNT